MARHKSIKVYLNEGELDAIRKASEKEGAKMGAWIRTLIRKALRRNEEL